MHKKGGWRFSATDSMTNRVKIINEKDVERAFPEFWNEENVEGGLAYIPSSTRANTCRTSSFAAGQPAFQWEDQAGMPSSTNVKPYKTINIFASKCHSVSSRTLHSKLSTSKVWRSCLVPICALNVQKWKREEMKNWMDTFDKATLRFFATPLPGARSRLKLRWTQPRHGQKMPAQNSTAEAKRPRSQAKKRFSRHKKDSQKNIDSCNRENAKGNREACQPLLHRTSLTVKLREKFTPNQRRKQYFAMANFKCWANTEGSSLSCRWPQHNVQLKSSILPKHWCSIR